MLIRLTGYPHDYIPAKGLEKVYDQMVTTAQSYEEKLIKKRHTTAKGVALALKIPVTSGDAAFLVEEIYRGRSAISGVPTRLRLIRWEVPETDTLLKIGEGVNEQNSAIVKLSDLVCMTKEEATTHEKEVLLGNKTVQDLYDSETIQRVKACQDEARKWSDYRGQ